MGKKCPRCKGTNTSSYEPRKMHCLDCSHSWRSYRHVGKKMKKVVANLFTLKKRVMPGSKTEYVGDDIFNPKKRRVKKRSF